MKYILFLVIFLVFFSCKKNKKENSLQSDEVTTKVDKAILYANLLDIANIQHNDSNNVDCIKRILGNYWTVKSISQNIDTTCITIVSNTHSYNEKGCFFLEYNSTILKFYFLKKDNNKSYYDDSNVILYLSMNECKIIANHVMDSNFISKNKNYFSEQKKEYFNPIQLKVE